MVCHVGNLGALNVKVIFDELVKLPMIKRGRIQGGLAPDALAFQGTGDQTNGTQDFNAHTFHWGYLSTDTRVDEQEVDHEVMAPSAPDHCATEAAGKPVGGHFEMKAKLTLWIGRNHALEVGQAASSGFSVAIMPPAFGSETSELAGISSP